MGALGLGCVSVCLCNPLECQCSHFTDEQTGSEKVPHRLKDSVAETQKVESPNRYCILREGHSTCGGSSGRGEATAAWGIRGFSWRRWP